MYKLFSQLLRFRCRAWWQMVFPSVCFFFSSHVKWGLWKIFTCGSFPDPLNCVLARVLSCSSLCFFLYFKCVHVCVWLCTPVYIFELLLSLNFRQLHEGRDFILFAALTTENHTLLAHYKHSYLLSELMNERLEFKLDLTAAYFFSFRTPLLVKYNLNL